MKRFNYHCIQCKGLIAASNKPLDVPNVCSNCEQRHTKAMVARQKEKLNINDIDKKENLTTNRRNK